MKMKHLFGVGALVATLAFSGMAQADDNVTRQEEKAKAQTETMTTAVQVAANAAVGMIGSRIATVQGPTGAGQTGMTGKASGTGVQGLGVWALGGAYYLDSTKSGAKYDGGLYSAMVGIDKEIDKLLVGVALGYEGMDIDTKYNDGSLKYNGFTVMPYASYAFTNDIIADMSVGMSWLDYDIEDTQNVDATNAALGTRKHDSSFDAFRIVTGIGVSKYYQVDKWLLSARLGALYINERQDSYTIGGTESNKQDIYVGQGTLGVRAAYDMGEFQPFAGLTYRQDLVKSGGDNDMAGGDLDLGFNWTPTEQVRIGLTGTYGIREDFSMIGGMLNARYQF